MKEQRLREILSSFEKVRIAVVGDYFLDKWLLIDRSRDEVSIETDLTAYQVFGKRICPGASGTILNNLSTLGVGTLYAVGFVGDDGEGYELVRELKNQGVNIEHIFKSGDVFTPTYIKPLFSSGKTETETNRLDIKNIKTTQRELEDKVIQNLWSVAPKVDALIALDQLREENCGVLTERVRQELANIADAHPDLIVYADSRAFTDRFRNVIIKCNHHEALAIISPDQRNQADLEIVKRCLLKMSETTHHRVFVTCGPRGVLAMNDSGGVDLVETVDIKGPIDICGAGDACSSGIVASMCMGASAQEAAFVGNLVSSLTIQQLGTTGTANRNQVIQRYLEFFGEGQAK